MSSLLKSTSVLVSLPTLMYVGLAQRKNRVAQKKAFVLSTLAGDDASDSDEE